MVIARWSNRDDVFFFFAVEFPMVMFGEKCQITKLFSFYSVLNLSMVIVLTQFKSAPDDGNENGGKNSNSNGGKIFFFFYKHIHLLAL